MIYMYIFITFSTFPLLPVTSGNFYPIINIYFLTKLYVTVLRVVRPVGVSFIMFGLVCDRLGCPSDLVKSWGGSVTVACRVPRWEVGLTGHSTNGGKLGFKYSSGWPHGQF